MRRRMLFQRNCRTLIAERVVVTPEEQMEQQEMNFGLAADRILDLMTELNDDVFREAFPQEHRADLSASNNSRFALYAYAKILANPEVGEVYTDKAAKLLIQTPFLISAVLGYRKRHRL